MKYAVGSLVRARDREWVVLPESEEDLLVLRPLGGTEDEVAGIYLPLEKVESAQFDLPDPTRSATTAPAGCCATPFAWAFAPAPGRSARLPGSPSSRGPTSSCRC